MFQWMVALLPLVLTASIVGGMTQAPATPSAFEAELESAQAVVVERHTPDEWKAANDTLEAALVNPEFATLPAKVQAAAFSGAAWGAVRLEDVPRARDRFAEATRLDPEAGWNWKMLAEAELLLEHEDAAAAALSRYVEGWTLPASEHSFVTRLVRQVDRSSEDRLRILQALFDEDWQRDARGASYFWYELALARASRQEDDAARAALGKITSPEFLVRVRADRQFDGLFDPASGQFDVALAAQLQAEKLRAQVGETMEASQDTADLMAALLMAGENDEALTLADKILAATLTLDGPPSALQNRASIAARRGAALRRLGRAEEALTQLEQAAGIQFSGRTNVNQTLDLANEYCSMGRGQDARDAATSVVLDMNPFGRLVQQYAHHCSSLLLGDAERSAKSLAYLAEHQAVGPEVYLWALVREGRLDEAARHVIDALADEQTRSDVLFSAQEFREAPISPGDVAMDANWTALIAREDVREAIERVGRIEKFEIYAP